MSDVIIIGFSTTTNKVQPLAWTDIALSKKQLKSAVRKFRNDSDFLEPYQAEWYRLYDSKNEAKKQLPRY